MKKEPTMFDLPDDAILYDALSARDTESGTYADMIAKFEQLYALHSASPVV